MVPVLAGSITPRISCVTSSGTAAAWVMPTTSWTRRAVWQLVQVLYVNYNFVNCPSLIIIVCILKSVCSNDGNTLVGKVDYYYYRRSNSTGNSK